MDGVRRWTLRPAVLAAELRSDRQPLPEIVLLVPALYLRFYPAHYTT